MTTTRRLTTAQAIVQFLKQQWVERDGERHPFFAGVFGIFGHGNVAGLGQALEEDGALPYVQARNEQGMVHAAAAFAKQHRRLRAFACTSSIGPGATNMVTAAAGATINRLPVLLLPGDIFARRNVAPVLQQLEAGWTQDISVNDCFKPISRYWDRIYRPEQIIAALPEALRVLTSPADTGAVTICLPQDVQAEAYDFPVEFFEERLYVIHRSGPDPESIAEATELIRTSRTPLIIAGGGVLYSQAEDALRRFCERTGIPTGMTQAGLGALAWDHPQSLGAIGHTGSIAANEVAADADLVLCVGTRLSDFTTASKTLFRNPNVKFLGINVAHLDAAKQGALAIVADAKVTLTMLWHELVEGDYRVSQEYATRVQSLRANWQTEADRIRATGAGRALSQAEVIAAVNDAMLAEDVVVCAAGSLPGDMHKLWRPVNGDQYHMEYGYSCMGYEIAGGLGIKLANPNGQVFVMVGDGSFLMMHGELVTAIQEGRKLIVVLVQNHGFASIHGLSLACGSQGFGNEFRFRNPKSGKLDGDVLPLDFVQIAQGLGADAKRVNTKDGLRVALGEARENAATSVIVAEVDPSVRVPGTGAWWDVPVAAISDMPSVQAARREYVEHRDLERPFI